MWPLIWAAARSYAPYLTLPAAAVIGFVGYNIESIFRKPIKEEDARPSVEVQRDQRMLKEMLNTSTIEPAPLSQKEFVPKTCFNNNDNKNLSPTLIKNKDSDN